METDEERESATMAALQSIASQFAVMFIQKRLEAGGTIEIPSLGISIGGHTPMEAGRELDVLVAEKVMGLRVTTFSGYDIATSCVIVDANDTITDRVPHYSTEIAAAWQVVELFGVRHSLSLYQVGRWYCNFLVGGKRLEACAPTAPHAICLAALRAVGEEK